jgi:hypothetical protein
MVVSRLQFADICTRGGREFRAHLPLCLQQQASVVIHSFPPKASNAVSQKHLKKGNESCIDTSAFVPALNSPLSSTLVLLQVYAGKATQKPITGLERAACAGVCKCRRA